MEQHRAPTIFEIAEQAARKQSREQPAEGSRKLKPAAPRKASGRTSRPQKPKKRKTRRV